MLDAERKTELAGALGDLLSHEGGFSRIAAGNTLNKALDLSFPDLTDDQKIDICDFFTQFSLVGSVHPDAPAVVANYHTKASTFYEAAAILRASGAGVLSDIDMAAVELIHVLGLETIFENADASFFDEADASFFDEADATFDALMGAFEDVGASSAESAEPAAESAEDSVPEQSDEETHGTLVVEL